MDPRALHKKAPPTEKADQILEGIDNAPSIANPDQDYVFIDDDDEDAQTPEGFALTSLQKGTQKSLSASSVVNYAWSNAKTLATGVAAAAVVGTVIYYSLSSGKAKIPDVIHYLKPINPFLPTRPKPLPTNPITYGKTGGVFSPQA